MALRLASRIRLPTGWPGHLREAILHIVSLAQLALAQVRGSAAYRLDARLQLAAQCDRLEQEIALLPEELRIKDFRLARIEPRKQPHYPAQERLAILVLRSALGWSLDQTAKTFLVTKAGLSFGR